MAKKKQCAGEEFRREMAKSLPFKKNDELVLEIEDIGSAGEGIGRADGYALFVKDTIAGDVVRVRITKLKKQYGYARAVEIMRPSPDRTEPPCPVSRQCGGCQLQHCSYERQLAWKQEKIRSCLQRIAGLSVGLPGEQGEAVVMEPILGMETPYRYRNKAQFPVGYDREGNLMAGFYAGRTHQVIPHTDCLIQHPCNQKIVDTVLDFMREYGITAYSEQMHSGLIRHILIRVGHVTGQVMVCLVINGRKLPHAEALIERLRSCVYREDAAAEQMGGAMKQTRETAEQTGGAAEFRVTSICLNCNLEQTNRILGEQIVPLYGQTYIEDYIGDIRYHISPLSFYQVNFKQTQRLYETALEYAGLQGNEVVWDLYCGIGTISLFLARKAARVYGVEIVPQAIENARENAEINHIENAVFLAGAAEDVVPQKYAEYGGLKADVVVLDPPRKGCDERLLETVVRMKPERIVYISCDPATLARDLKRLCETGYVLQRVRGCDMFAMSYHVETICLLSKL